MASSPVDVVLASGSPRRLELLRDIGVEPLVRPADIDETPLEGEDPAAYVERLARAKARHVADTVASTASTVPTTVVIGADTTVTIDGEILGKPASDDDARAMLRRLSHRRHVVHTGVAVSVGAVLYSAVETTEVGFRLLSEPEIDWYVATGDASDKAGAYGIQGAAGAFVDGIRGSPDNVIGLPRALVDGLLREAGLSLHALRTPAH